MAPADVQALGSQCPAKDAELKATGKLVVSASLQGPQAAFALRPRSSKPAMTDGPYAEAKEMVGGFLSSRRPARKRPYAAPRYTPRPRWVNTSAGASSCTR